MNNTPTVAIIGGGFCGALTLIQLVEQAKYPLSIVLINNNNQTVKGIAYSSYNPKHVLNVPAAKMSAFPDDPDNFINWIKSKPEYSEFVNEELNDRFLPRVIYGRYLEELFNNTMQNLPGNVTVKILNDEAIDIIPSEDKSEIIFKSNESVEADKIILAVGNFKPDDPYLTDSSFYKSNKYFQNPWNKNAVEGLKNKEDVLIIGTGLTMVDNVLSLLHNGFDGKIYAVSTNGYFPLSHKKRKPYTVILEELHPPYSISKLYSIFRKHIKYVLSHGITGEAVVDAVRPKTQEIWLSLTLEDKLKFMSHIRHLWGVARHRLPKEIFDQMQELISKGKLKIIGGRIQNIKENNDKIIVTVRERKSQKNEDIIINRVINCTGPKTDLNKINEPLVKNLLERGIIVPDEMKLGINALPDGTIIHKDHSLSVNFYTIGSLMKGILWESTAVPELRVQAKNLASQIIKQLYTKKELSV